MELLISHIKALTEEVEICSHLFMIYQRWDEIDVGKIAVVHQEDAGVSPEGKPCSDCLGILIYFTSVSYFAFLVTVNYGSCEYCKNTVKKA